MAKNSLQIRHVRLFIRNWIRFTLRSGSGIVFLMATMVFGMITTQTLLGPIEKILVEETDGMPISKETMINLIIKDGQKHVQWILDENPKANTQATNNPNRPGAIIAFGDEDDTTAGRWTSYLLYERPALLSILYLILMYGMPFIIIYLGFNQMAGDIHSRGLRYLLFRTARINLYYGRFLGAVLFSAIVIACMITLITLYVGIQIGIYAPGELLGWAFQGFIMFSILMIPYLAICTAVSSSVSTPFLALATSELIVIGAMVAPSIGESIWGPLENLKYVLPWGIQKHLFHPDWQHFLGAAAGCIGYSLVFSLLGYVRFQRRDL